MKRDGGKGEGLRMKMEDRKGGGGGGGGLFLGRGEARKLKGAPNYGTMRDSPPKKTCDIEAASSEWIRSTLEQN